MFTGQNNVYYADYDDPDIVLVEVGSSDDAFAYMRPAEKIASIPNFCLRFSLHVH